MKLLGLCAEDTCMVVRVDIEAASQHVRAVYGELGAV